MTITYEEAVRIMREAHFGQVDKCGEIYPLHPLRVSKRFKDAYKDEIATQAALFHDLFEDTPVTETNLKEWGVDEEVIKIVNILTRKKEERYFDYIRRIKDSKNVRAIYIKIADLEDNLRPSPEGESLRQRYFKALNILVGG